MAFRVARTLLLVTLAVGCAFPRLLPDFQNDGLRWEREFFTTAQSRDLDVSGDRVLWASSDGIYHNSSGKFSRARILLPGSPEIVAIAISGRGAAYAVTDRGILLRSADRGSIWEMIGEFPGLKVNDLSVSEDGVLFAATSAGVLVSATDLSTAPAHLADRPFLPWEALVMALPIWRKASVTDDSSPPPLQWTLALPGAAERVAASPVSEGVTIAELSGVGAYLSRDAGATWTAIRLRDGSQVAGPAAFGGDGSIVVGRFIGSAGASFRPLALPIGFGLRVRSTAIADSFIYTLDGGGNIYRGADGIWHRIGRGASFRSTESEIAARNLGISQGGELYVGTDGHGLFRRPSDNQLESGVSQKK